MNSIYTVYKHWYQSAQTNNKEVRTVSMNDYDDEGNDNTWRRKRRCI